MAASPRPSSFVRAKRFLAHIAELHAQLPPSIQIVLEMTLAGIGLVILWALGGLVAMLRGHWSDLFVNALSFGKEFATFAIVGTEMVRGLERFKVLNGWPRRVLKSVLSGVAVAGILVFAVLALDGAIDSAGSHLKALPALLKNLSSIATQQPTASLPGQVPPAMPSPHKVLEGGSPFGRGPGRYQRRDLVVLAHGRVRLS